MRCWRTLILHSISTWIYINKTLFLLSFDYAVMEKSKEIYTLPSDESKVVVQDLDGYIVAEKNGQLVICLLQEKLRIKEFGK